MDCCLHLSCTLSHKELENVCCHLCTLDVKTKKTDHFCFLLLSSRLLLSFDVVQGGRCFVPCLNQGDIDDVSLVGTFPSRGAIEEDTVYNIYQQIIHAFFAFSREIVNETTLKHHPSCFHPASNL